MPIQRAPQLLKRVLSVGVIALTLTVPFANAQIFKCKINGQIVYTDKACPADTEEPLDLPQLIAVPATEITDHAASGGSLYTSSRWYDGHEGYRQAQRVSNAKNAPIYIYAYTDWCGYCKKFESSMLPLPNVQQVLSNYVKVRLNPEHSSQDRKLFKRWGGSGYPSFWVQQKNSGAPARSRGPFRNKQLISSIEYVEHYTIKDFAQ